MPKTAAKQAETTERKMPTIKPGDVQVEAAHFSFKEVSIKLDLEITLQDFNDHPETLWRNVQADRMGKALAEYDRVELRARDWTAWGVVNFADRNQVILYNLKRAEKPQREVALYSDDHYEVRWTADGYTYFRKRDGTRMSGPSYPTAEAAKMALIREQYPAQLKSM